MKAYFRLLWAWFTGKAPAHCHECGNEITGGMWSEGAGGWTDYRCTDCGPGPDAL
ncbi:hypothetical protein [Streptomyces montanus]|uniref:hypothetical protein n=1 Tax=Streptomyces montanus TaxID=2580423 RepID=UPI001485E8D3|nr:hypothetical protein [Streptomyces montanus]